MEREQSVTDSTVTAEIDPSEMSAIRQQVDMLNAAAEQHITNGEDEERGEESPVDASRVGRETNLQELPMSVLQVAFGKNFFLHIILLHRVECKLCL